MKIDPADLPRVLGDVIGEVKGVLDAIGLQHALIGGLAVGAHARARATKDVDLAVSAGEDGARRVIAAMEARGFAARVSGVPGPGAVVRFSRTGPDGVVRWVDFLFAGTPFEEAAIGRAETAQVLGRSVRLVSIEDLLVYKLLAGRPQDVADAVALVQARGTSLDRSYLESACDAWELRGELARIEAMAVER